MSAAQDLLNDQQEFIRALQDSSNSAQLNAKTAVSAAKPPDVKYAPLALPPAYVAAAPPQPPTFSVVELDLPAEPAPLGELVGISEANTEVAPVFSLEAPTLEFGSTPSAIAEFQGTSPAIMTNFDFPDAPSQMDAVYSPPTLIDRAAPDAPDITTVRFDEAAPVNDTRAPGDVEGTYRAAYADMSNTMLTAINGQMDAYLTRINPKYHSQMAKIEAQLETYLAGGTGLKPEIEDAIYSRAREKNDVEAARVRSAAYAEAASRGFTLPTGALMSAIGRARQEAANNNLKASSDIAVMQAETEQKNLQFAVTTSQALRATAIQAMLSYMQGATTLNGMALEYAKGILDAVVQVYDIQVKSFTLKLEAYKAAAQVYEVKVRASAQVIEIYKAQIQALEAMTNVDRAKIDIYRAQIDSLKAYGDLYKTQIDTVVSRASLEKLKLDLFESQVKVYSGQVQAKAAEWQGYQARLAGEETKVKAFSAQVDAFNGQIAAYKARTEGISEKIKAEAIKNNATLQAYTAGVSAYESLVKAKAATASANIDGQRQELTGYQAAIGFAESQARLKVEAYKANLETGIMNAKTDMDAQVANANSGVGQMNALAAIHGEILKTYYGPASAAAAGMNSLASINFDE
jgi:predicted  nucleic acid-binding Zn-ribbon protein